MSAAFERFGHHQSEALTLAFERIGRRQLAKADWHEEQHPRGASAPGHSGGEFASTGGGGGGKAYPHETARPGSQWPYVRSNKEREVTDSLKQMRETHAGLIRQNKSASHPEVADLRTKMRAAHEHLQQLKDRRIKELENLDAPQSDVETVQNESDKLEEDDQNHFTRMGHLRRQLASQEAASYQRTTPSGASASGASTASSGRQPTQAEMDASAAEEAAGKPSTEATAHAQAALEQYQAGEAEQTFREDFGTRSAREQVGAGGLLASIGNLAHRVARTGYLVGSLMRGASEVRGAAGDYDFAAMGQHLMNMRRDLTGLVSEMHSLPREAKVFSGTAARNLGEARDSLLALKARIAAARKARAKAKATAVRRAQAKARRAAAREARATD